MNRKKLFNEIRDLHKNGKKDEIVNNEKIIIIQKPTIELLTSHPEATIISILGGLCNE
jgi:hypothetical protein